MKFPVYCVVYSTRADGWEDNGVLDNAYYTSREDARKAMKEACKNQRKSLKADYDLENFEDVRKADYCAFSADERVSYKVEVVELVEKGVV